MGKSVHISNRFLGILLFIALVIQYILPQAGINSFGSVSVLIYLIMAIYLFFA